MGRLMGNYDLIKGDVGRGSSFRISGVMKELDLSKRESVSLPDSNVTEFVKDYSLLRAADYAISKNSS